jgi:predicted transcriptional regulator
MGKGNVALQPFAVVVNMKTVLYSLLEKHLVKAQKPARKDVLEAYVKLDRYVEDQRHALTASRRGS